MRESPGFEEVGVMKYCSSNITVSAMRNVIWAQSNHPLENKSTLIFLMKYCKYGKAFLELKYYLTRSEIFQD